MADDSVEVQNTGEEQTPASQQPQEGDQKTDQQTQKTSKPADDGINQEGSKKDDLVLGIKKWRTKAQELAKEKEAWEKSQTNIQTKPENEQTPNPEESQKQAMDQLKGMMKDVVSEQLQPIMKENAQKNWNEAIDHASKLPYMNEFGEKVIDLVQTMRKEDSSFSGKPALSQLKTAYNQILAENIGNIVNKNQEDGMNKAYDNQAVKKGQQSSSETPNKAGQNEKPILDRVKDMSIKEYKEHREEILKAEKERMGVS